VDGHRVISKVDAVIDGLLQMTPAAAQPAAGCGCA
jgi:hypothetical protein